ncbi:MAG: SGNH/GDSL hydrolase family protein [Phycisphaeraceae bacterium]|nr:SGNH/GDSL hydrolase family protein [Phycisphaeraceae bacterium]
MQPPLLFVLGDSISIHYGPFLQALLGPSWRYQRKGSERGELEITDPRLNGGDSACVLEYLSQMQARQLRPDCLLLNCGLHDVKITPPAESLQVPPDQYRANLKTILAQASALARRVVWVRTTPVDDQQHNVRHAPGFIRYNRHVQTYNQIADELVAQANLPTIDLYEFSLRLNQPLYEDHIHFLPPVRQLQAAFIAGHLLALAR